MIKKLYSTDEERKQIIDDMLLNNKTLLEDVVRSSKKYLLFIGPDETKPYILENPEPTETEKLEQRLKATEDALLQLMLGGM